MAKKDSEPTTPVETDDVAEETTPLDAGAPDDPTIAIPDAPPAPAAAAPSPPPRTAAMPGSVRSDLLAAAQRDLRRPNLPVLARLEEALAEDERVDALTLCDPDGSVLAATDQRLLVVQPGSAAVVDARFDELRDVVALPFGRRRAVVCPLRPGEPFDGWVARRDQAKTVVAFAREQRLPRRDASSEDAWYDDPAFSLGARYDDAAVIVAPDDSTIPGRTAVVASIVTTGVQLTTVGEPAESARARTFVPWSEVRSATLEPTERSMARPGVAVAIGLGVPGASKRASSRRACLALSTDAGEHVLVLRGYTLSDTARALAPVFARMPGATVSIPTDTSPSAPAGSTSVDPIDQIRRLGELRDEGLLTEEEFGAKKAELLERI